MSFYDNTPLPAAKSDRFPPNNPTQQWGADDANAVFTALSDHRAAISAQHANVLSFGAKGDGSTDDTAAIQAAISATAGIPLYLPRGRYIVSSTLQIPTTSHKIVGDFANRSLTDSGTEIAYTGTGPCIQIGSDNGHAWDAGDYDGPQGHMFQGLLISHAAPNTPLASAPGAGNVYKAGAYGIWDWRGGQIVMRDVWIEKFEANFVGIQSDINSFYNVLSLYSKYGIYLGPRSDQCTIRDMYSFFCDRAITIDRAGQTRIDSAQLVFCGTDTASSIEIRQGSHGVRIHNTWLERSGSGYQGTDAQSFVSVGEVAGYGAGGSVQAPGGAPTTASVQGCVIDFPHCYNVLIGGASHTKYLASVGKCTQFLLAAPSEYINSGLNNFDALVGIQNNGINPTSADTQIEVTGVPSTLTRAKIFTNTGAGSPQVTINATGTLEGIALGIDNTASHVIRGAVSHAAPPNANAFTTTNSLAGQTVGFALWKLRLDGSFDTSAGAVFPTGLLIQSFATRSAGANSVGQTALSLDAMGAQSNTALTTERGDNRLNTSSGMTEHARATYLSNEIAPASLGADQTDWSPAGLADAALVIITSSLAVAINSLALDANAAGGRDIVLYNGNAAGGFNVTLKDEAAALGTASRRFAGRAHADTVLTPGTAARCRYSASKSRILIVGDSL